MDESDDWILLAPTAAAVIKKPGTTAGVSNSRCSFGRRGVESFDVDIEEQKVVNVKGNVTPDAVLETVSKTGKKTSFWEAEHALNKED